MSFGIQDGTNQSERMTPCLDPHYFKIEERETGDFLKFAIDLASLFNYYNFNNQVDGNWEDFFDSDIDVLVTVITRLDVKGSIRQFEELARQLQEAEDEAEVASALNWIFTFLKDGSVMLLKFKAKLELANNRNAETAEMASIIEGVKEDIALLISSYYQGVQVFAGIRYIDFSAIGTDVVPPFDKENNMWLKGSSLKERMLNALPLLQNLFGSFRQRYNRLKTEGERYVQKQRHEGSTFDPHISLFVSFLHLYGYLKNEINTITGRHLHFYYKEVLGITPRQKIPDRIHLVFEPVPSLTKLVLPVKEKIIAEVPGTKQQLLYQTEQDVIISNAKIKELKTQYISRLIQVPAKQYRLRHIEECKIYTGNYPVAQPADFLKKRELLTPWPVLGEEQSEMLAQQRTMADAVLGLLIGSPVLYLADGKRSVRIRMYILPASAEWFKKYIANFAGITGASESVVSYRLLSRAFVIGCTGSQGWMAIDRYSSRCIFQSGGDTFIEIDFALTEKQPPISVYVAEVHGVGIPLKTPAVKLEINNNSFHNACSFLRQIEIERISVKADVTGSQSIRLQNSFGPLSQQVPFQPFGPLPSIDSYFEVKSTNIFNRFTKRFSIHLQWFDLPKLPGGFETYFHGYGNHVTNNSFKVAISAVRNGQSIPENKLRQTFNLFETTRDDYGRPVLKDDSEIGTSDFSRISFTNGLLMNGENNNNTDPTSLFKEGTVRVELVEPADAFGNRLYPYLLPQIMMRNAKRFTTKVPVPNPPYIPVVKTMHVDYTLEHTEMIQKKQSESAGTDLALIHLYPFGYEAVYPSANANPIFVMPLPGEGSSLLIGLEDAAPGQEISLFFQLDEMNFHHTAHQIEAVKWSYLCNNNWADFKLSDVLADSTNNFVNSGIVKLLLPLEGCLENTILTIGLIWLRASVTSTKMAASRVVGLFTQAVTATRVREEDSETENTPENLPAGSVKGFVRKIPEITNVRHFFPAWGGRQQETNALYRTRISERLRHKHRPLTAMDISQMILEAFPEIFMVKCFGPGSSEKFILPSVNVQVLVLPKAKENSQFVSEEPKVSLATLFRIKQYINEATSCFARIEVGNPVYEKIKIVCSIIIKKDKVNTNSGYYLKMLNEDIKHFISPWLFSSDQEIKIGGRVFVLDVINYIQNRPYISYITGFSVLHFYKKYNRLTGFYEDVMKDSSTCKTNYLEASRPDAVLIAAPDHFITELNDFAYAPPIASGIGDLLIGSELSVNLQEATEVDTEAGGGKKEEEAYFDFNF